MAFHFPNPLRALLGYLRGDDIRAANAETLAHNRVDRAAGAMAASTTPGTPPPPKPEGTGA